MYGLNLIPQGKSTYYYISNQCVKPAIDGTFQFYKYQ